MSRMIRFTEEQLKKFRERRQLLKREQSANPRTPTRKLALEPKPDWARELALQIRAAGLPEPIIEFAWDKQLEGSGRGWRFDLYWRERLFAVEVDGAVHRIKGRYNADIPKMQYAFAAGIKVLHVTPEQVRSGEALELIKDTLAKDA